ncbi:ABC transporter ATP-binding protein [Frondihabitans cladoniiphilus]|uniref:ABC transporter ATP-binding protein n=1 Tax=Frondihabitans cladoniiphilus TaxID=715785 RepID=A0ABP8W6G8_9MICO
MPEPLLSVRDLVVTFRTPAGVLTAIDGVSFDVFPGEVLCIVGESGSGKSVLNLAIMGLLPPNAKIESGQVLYRGEDIAEATPKRMRELRGSRIAMVFQDPMTALNPVRRVGRQIGEMIRLHDKASTAASRKERAIDLLREVGVPDAEARYDAYPHQFSGGMRQRATIAMAMANRPALLIADEPTTALDVTIQAQVMDVLSEVRAEVGSSMILVTHDLGLVAEAADRVAVMYSGRLVETGTVDEIFHEASHPYTIGLLRSLLRTDSTTDVAYAIPGQPPTLATRPSGCAFQPRCAIGRDRPECGAVVPPLVRLADPVVGAPAAPTSTAGDDDGHFGAPTVFGLSDADHLAACLFADEAEALLAEADARTTATAGSGDPVLSPSRSTP